MPGPDEICLSFSRFAISQPILMVEVSKCSSRKVRGWPLSAYFDRSSNKTAIGPTIFADQPDDWEDLVRPVRPTLRADSGLV